MMRSEALRAAQEAVEWAKRPCFEPSGVTNFEAVKAEVAAWRASETPVLTFKAVFHDYWPCLSRLLAMGDPDIAWLLDFHYIDDLDCQAGATLMSLWFKEVTGEAPKARSWRHARQEVCWE